MLAAPAGRLPPESRPALAELAEEPFVLPSPRAARGLRLDVDAACSSAGFDPKIVREADSLTAVLLLVAGRTGGTSPSSRRAPPTSTRSPGSSTPTSPRPAPRTDAGMAWRANDPSHLLGHFLDTTRTVAASRRGEPDVWPERRIVEAATEG